MRTETIYLSNWSSHKTPGHHGPGRWKWTIMAKPRHWERGHGRVTSLTPSIEDMESAKLGAISLYEYRRRFMRMARWSLMPLEASVGSIPNASIATVRNGDTLCCACSRAAAARGECHRVWAARLLHEAGWRVILDGKELNDEN